MRCSPQGLKGRDTGGAKATPKSSNYASARPLIANDGSDNRRVDQVAKALNARSAGWQRSLCAVWPSL